MFPGSRRSCPSLSPLPHPRPHSHASPNPPGFGLLAVPGLHTCLRRPHMPFPLSGMRAPGWAPRLRRGTRWKALMPSHLLTATRRTLSCFSSSFSVPPNVLPSLSASSAFPVRSMPPGSRAAAPPGTHMCFVISERTAESGPEEARHVGLNEGTARACFTTCEALSHSVCYSSFMIALCGAHSREIGALGYSRRR